jgi:hypothetical protein
MKETGQLASKSEHKELMTKLSPGITKKTNEKGTCLENGGKPSEGCLVGKDSTARMLYGSKREVNGQSG